MISAGAHVGICDKIRTALYRNQLSSRSGVSGIVSGALPGKSDIYLSPQALRPVLISPSLFSGIGPPCLLPVVASSELRAYSRTQA